MRRYLLAIALAATVSSTSLVVPQSATAAPCIIGPVTRSATFKYLDQWDSQLLGYNVYMYVKITGYACYDNTTSFGTGVSTTWWGPLGMLGAFGPSYYTSAGTTTFWYSPAFKETFMYEMHTYPRLKITKTGVWSCQDGGSVTKTVDGVAVHGPEFDPVFISCWLS